MPTTDVPYAIYSLLPRAFSRDDLQFPWFIDPRVIPGVSVQGSTYWVDDVAVAEITDAGWRFYLEDGSLDSDVAPVVGQKNLSGGPSVIDNLEPYAITGTRHNVEVPADKDGLIISANNNNRTITGFVAPTGGRRTITLLMLTDHTLRIRHGSKNIKILLFSRKKEKFGSLLGPEPSSSQLEKSRVESSFEKLERVKF